MRCLLFDPIEIGEKKHRVKYFVETLSVRQVACGWQFWHDQRSFYGNIVTDDLLVQELCTDFNRKFAQNDR